MAQECPGCVSLLQQLEEERRDFADFKDETRVYESQSEGKIASLTKSNKDLLRDLEAWKSKFSSKVAEDSLTIKLLHDRLDSLSKTVEEYRKDTCNLEIQNDSLQQTCREYQVSVGDLESKFNNALEKSIFLEQELEYAQSKMEEENQRLKDELKGWFLINFKLFYIPILRHASDELSILKIRLDIPAPADAPEAFTSLNTKNDNIQTEYSTEQDSSEQLINTTSPPRQKSIPVIQILNLSPSRLSAIPKPSPSASLDTLSTLTDLLERAKSLETRLSSARGAVAAEMTNVRYAASARISRQINTSNAKISRSPRSPSVPSSPHAIKFNRPPRASLPTEVDDIYKFRRARGSLETSSKQNTIPMDIDPLTHQSPTRTSIRGSNPSPRSSRLSKNLSGKLWLTMSRQSGRLRGATKFTVAETLSAYKQGLLDENEDEEKAKIYDELPEEDYIKISKKKRMEGDNFVEDDDGVGYADYGQNDWESEEYSDEEEELNRHNSKGKKTSSKLKKVPPKLAKKDAQIATFFANASKKSKSTPKVETTEQEDEDLMKSIFADVDDSISKRAPKRQKTTELDIDFPPNLQTLAKIKLEVQTTALESSSSQQEVAPTPQPSVSVNGTASINDFLTTDDVVADFSEVHNMLEDSKITKPNYLSEIDDENDENDEKEMQVLGTKIKALTKTTTKKPISAELASTIKKFEKTLPAKPTVVRDLTNVGCEDWSVNRERAVGVNTSAMKKIDLNLVECLENDGSLNMFWIDACEVRGSMFLFGKVATKSGAFVSCCVKVEGMQRAMYFLPRENILNGG
ncbi:DNA-directed DNA polymerase alpha catalytic subunit pol1, partial [Nowakowskiella sp. JEL0078]